MSKQPAKGNSRQAARRAIKQQMAAGDVAGARASIDEVLTRWSDQVDMRLFEARILEAEGRQEEAEEAYHAVEVQFPADARATLGLARMYISKADATEAAAALERAETRGANSVIVGRLRGFLWRKTGDWAAIREDLETRDVAGQDEADVQRALAEARLREGDYAGAVVAATTCLGLDPTRAPALQVLNPMRGASWRRGGRAEALPPNGRPRGSERPSRVENGFKLLNMVGRIDEASDHLADAVQRWPDDPHLSLFILRRRSVGHWRATMERAAAVTVTATPAGRIVADEASILRAAIALAPSDDRLRRPLVEDAAEKDVLVAQSSTGRPAVIVFTPATDCFGLPLREFDRYLAALDATAIYVRDFGRLMYFSGVKSLGDFDETLEQLGSLARSCGAAGLRTLGCSGAGFASVRYGVDLNASHILSFSGDTNRRHEDEFDRIKDGPVKVLAARMRERIPAERLELAPFLRAKVFGQRSRSSMGPNVGMIGSRLNFWRTSRV